jgi:hypothetical protein
MNSNKKHKASFLVLDYKKKEECTLCIQSIKKLVQFPYEIVLLDNGGNEDYVFDLYRNGLVDTLISKRNGMGGGFGQSDLFRWCDTEYAFFIQSDQFLNFELTEEHLAYFIALLNNGYNCIDLNGDQSNRGVWTDRAHFMKTDFFNSLGPFPNGGPGPFHHLPWNERYLQDKFQESNYSIAHIKPAVFKDNGVFTVREISGGLLKMRTDTKQVWWLKNPVEKYIFPEMYDDEWEKSINGTWVDGTTPRKYIENNSVFNCWGDRNV